MLSLSFSGCLIRHSSFAELKMLKVKFTGCTLQKRRFLGRRSFLGEFHNATFENCIFRNTNLTKADFRYATGYYIDPTLNKVKGARFSSPGRAKLAGRFRYCDRIIMKQTQKLSIRYTNFAAR